MRLPFLLALFVCVVIAASTPARTSAAVLQTVSDTIATSSAPSALTTTHTIRFTTVTAIPASGKIVITPAAGSFTIPAALDHTDIDLATSSGSTFTDRSLAASASATQDGVSVVTGTSGSITITLNSAYGIGAGVNVLVEIGANATSQATGDQHIRNPAAVGTYRIALETRDASDISLDTQRAMIAVVAPVSVEVLVIPVQTIRSNGQPSGTIAAGHSVIEISLETDVAAICRYSLIADTSYDSMTETFNSSTSSLNHFRTLSGFVDGQTYTYYVRCKDTTFNVKNTTDFVITFTIANTPESQSSVAQESLGRGGAGPFPSGSSVLFTAAVSVTGWSSPGSTVTVLRDSVKQVSVQAKPDGTFRADLPRVERGTYTYLTYSEDSKGRKSASFTSTISLIGGTVNTITDVITPPTIALSKESVSLAEEVVVSGESVPGIKIEAEVLKVGSANPADHKRFTATTTAAGLWEVRFGSRELSKGTYEVRARAMKSEQLESTVSNVLRLGVGEAPAPGAAQGDINGDSKVNLIDFSIMLTHWGTDEASADFNNDGIVSLADFSILLFNWTG